MTSSDEPTWIDYAEFGERFVAAAVTESRIESAVSGVAGRGITIGPFGIGPAGLARFVAKGSIGKPSIIRRGPHVHFDVMLPVKLRVDVTLGGQRLRLEAVVEIDLTMHARTADPLLIVIDIPPVTGRDVSFVMRAQAIGTAWELLLNPIAQLVQREVANRINGILADPDSQRSRTFDVEAILNNTRSPYRGRPTHDWIGYDEFGRRFFTRIVTAERVQEVVESMAGKPIEVGPIRTGPGNKAEVWVQGSVRLPKVAEATNITLTPPPPPRIAELPKAAAESEQAAANGAHAHDPALVRFDLMIPVSLDISVDVLKTNRYRAEVQVPVALTARAAEPLLIVIDAVPPRADDIDLDMTAEGWRAAALGKLAGMRKQIAAQVAKVVRAEVADVSRRTIDVGARLNSTRV
ncbi:hypothetical protein [Nocardia seriolae]|uniref:Uncharacterized protein n=1 Tax=Nocardia seriolae TaxID=37332 RepID=A0A0B8N6B8_9NOCA|nr:hypothetical protein [Nocardia seriolae]APA95946.1 hypothetical protein NS506_01878 [Nocardia seriolae]MTJ65956.1 hypothetical protein [Nocardia seriolae]MTJ73172.1 hypothetical protein [Nocardia seriolae]MTJ86118.1 hypothetical protein [Nocardia seriolae]MTK30114.1 hypothetical protein [Nocardia seriolae]